MFKKTVFKHIVRINPSCNDDAGKRLHTELRKLVDVVDTCILGNHVIYVYSKRCLRKDLRKLAKKLKFNIIFSWVEDSDRNPEDNCGLELAGTVNKEVILPDNRLTCFGFAAQLVAETPLRFGKWEKNTIPFPKGKIKKYYFEHFIDDDARNKIKPSFYSGLGQMAYYMTDNRFGLSFPWDYITDCFDKGSK
jgi:hypothetical protein